ncbi:hypothetical protein HXX76_013947 [Chlamydomonas incerta]|uniref:Uncharacterized protein n=1 Tax=Chlamydomonas incerta TaxID=51695 RepID=A0A835SN18_CHLIN|nr:hypothetical protein HXX76_013947 [Chlamydomonas incerta]|eukprot:KAG2425194.1 hypothetical protein HXX76_013947 [Chlamydomonas incerta]
MLAGVCSYFRRLQRLQLETRLAELGATPPAPGHAPANPRAELVAAHAAFKQGQGAGSSAVRTRLAWKHAYQEQLEEFYALGKQLPGPAVPLTGAQVELASKRDALERQLAATEQVHNIERWPENDAEFRRTAEERKLFRLQKLERDVTRDHTKYEVREAQD